MESAVTAPVSGHVKRVVVQEGAFHSLFLSFAPASFVFQQVILSIKVISLSKSSTNLSFRSDISNLDT